MINKLSNTLLNFINKFKKIINKILIKFNQMIFITDHLVYDKAI